MIKKILLVICLCVFSILAKSQVSDTSADNDPKKVWIKVDHEPEFPGGIEHLLNYLTTNIKYPEEAKRNGISGKVFVSFVVEKDGSLTDIRVVQSLSPELDAEAIRLIKEGPKWRPGSAAGVPCRVQYSLPINFELDSFGKKTKEDAKIFSWVENMPGFPGGFNAYNRFLASNLTYPEKARLKGVKGIVKVDFVVEKDGGLSHIEVRKSFFKELDEEAIRVINISPKWTAGMQNGRPVRVQFSLPITFPPEPLAVPKDTAVFYIKMVGDRETQVDSKDKADFYRMVLPPDTTVDKTLGIINDFYKNGHKKMIGGAIIIEQQLLLSGPCMEFYENGKRKSIKNYVDGVQTGEFSQYYPNGRLYITGEYDPKGNRIIKEARDTTGKVTASDGTGNLIIYTNDFKRIVEEGPLLNGVEEGEWHGMSADSARSVLSYKHGLFQNGKTFKKGLIDPENTPFPVPAYPGGIDAFYKFLQNTIRYPAVAKAANVQGQVFVSFTVERDGTLTNIHVAKGAGSGLDEEAMRVIKLSSKWNPAIQGGIPVREQYTIPIAFILQVEN